MAPTDGDIYKVVVNIELPSLVMAQNVYAWELSDPTPDNPTNTNIMDALELKLTSMYEDLDSQLADDVYVDDFEVDKVEWNDTLKYWETVESLGSEVLAVPGTNVDDSAPHGCACVVTADTSWPKTRARKFIPGVAEGAFTDSTLDGATLTALAAYVVEWLTDRVVVGDADLLPVVLAASGTKEGQALGLLAAGASAIVGYQRRRKPGVGS